jgi:CubicO group peptidase (beta-lactamase class C family)
MTSFGSALLVERGLCTWDEPVQFYLPDLQLFNQVATEHLTLRDMLCHRSGLPYYQLFWHHSALTRQEMADRLRFLPPSKDFRASYQYNNLMYMLAGHFIERLSGDPWELFIQNQVLNQLGMNASRTSYDEVVRDANCALPHIVKDGRTVPIRHEKLKAVAPAGGVYTNAEDMLRWMDMVIQGESPLLSAANFKEWLNPVLAVPNSRLYPEKGGNAYALGWNISHYKGRHMVFHGGAGMGYASICVILPDDEIGVSILINVDKGQFPQIPAYHLLDLMLGMEVTPWNARIKREAAEAESLRAASVRNERSLVRDCSAGSTYSEEELCGSYEHPGLGTIIICQESDGLHAVYNGLRYKLTFCTGNRFEASGSLKSVTFIIQNNERKISVPFEPALDEITFART